MNSTIKILIRSMVLSLLFNSIYLQAAEPEVDDERIRANVTQAIRNDSLTQDALMVVASVRGYVLLAGQVLSQEARDKATNIAAMKAGGSMRRLINELQIVDTLDDSTTQSDLALANTIAEALKSEKPALAERVKVLTHHSTVYLMGAVTREQAQEAGTFISKIPGIASIKTVFEYVKE